jgi:hypothetical protein
MSVDPDALERDPEQLARIAKHAMCLVQARMKARLQNARSRTAPGKSRERRHVGNEPMRMLIGTLNTLWATYFRELPGVSHFETPAGAYLNFVHAILHAFAAGLDGDLGKAPSGMSARLRLTPHAIHGYFRRTRLSALMPLAMKLAEKNAPPSKLI